MGTIPTRDQIARAVADRFINPRIILNTFRAGHAEEIVRTGLRDEFNLMSGWEAYDLVRKSDNLRLEVKQAAALQTWAATANGKRFAPTFDIAPRTGEFGPDSVWIESPEVRRFADIYVFCVHDRTDGTCDQCDPTQWQFYVLPTNALPSQSSISLGTLQKLAQPVTWEELYDGVALAAKRARP